MTPFRIALGATMLAAALITSAAAQPDPLGDTLYDAITGEELRDFVESRGQAVELLEDQDGDPLIAATTTDGFVFRINTYDCEQRGEVRACGVLHYRVSFADTGLSELDSLRAANEWNATRIHGRAFRVPDGRLELDMVMTLTRGTPSSALAEAHAGFVTLIGEFAAGLAR